MCKEGLIEDIDEWLVMLVYWEDVGFNEVLIGVLVIVVMRKGVDFCLFLNIWFYFLLKEGFIFLIWGVFFCLERVGLGFFLFMGIKYRGIFFEELL